MLKNLLSSIPHKEIREIAITLNYFCVIEISIITFFTWQAYELLHWYESIMTVEHFNATAFWAAVSGIIAAIFGAVKFINDTFNNRLSLLKELDKEK